jgi:ARG/rhodanese/phosphatase superfamily protein
MAVAVGSRVVCVDVFDKPTTCQKVWNRLLSSFVFDALDVKPDGQASMADVERLLAAANEMKWEPSPAVGEGEELRAESENGDHASALQFEGATIHGNVLMAEPVNS